MSNVNAPLESLDNFAGWDTSSPEEDFFAELDRAEGSSVDSEPILKTGEVVEPSDEEKEEEKVSEEITEDDLFEDFEEEDTSFISREEEEEEEEQPQDKVVLSYLKERGLISFDEEEEVDSEYFLEDKFNEAIENRVQDLFEELPDVVKQLNTFVLKGGNINEFLGEVAKAKSKGITEDLDITSEENQEFIVRETMEAEGNDPEIIEAQIEFLKDSGKLELFAKRDFNRWKKETQQAREALVKQQKEQEKVARERIRESKKRMSDFLKTNETIGNLSLNRDDVREIPSYVNDRTVKLQNGSYISQMQKELYYDLPQNEEAYLQLAALMRNRNEDGTFNFQAIEEEVKTKVTKGYKDNVRRKRKTVPGRTRSSNANTGARTLADFFK